MEAEVQEAREVLIQGNYDKQMQHELEVMILNLLRELRRFYVQPEAYHVAYNAEGVQFISNPDAIADLEKILQLMKQLCYKYHEPVTIIENAEKQFEGLTMLPTLYTIQVIKELQAYEIMNVAVKHKLMDSVREKEPWEEEVKKKFFLHQNPEWEAHEKVALGIKPEWKRFEFYKTAYMVLMGGDIIELKSGINNSGKTESTLAEQHYANYLLRQYWKVSWNPHKHITIPAYSLRKNVFYYPDASLISEKVAEDTQFNIWDVNEGMKTAINVKAWDPNSIDMTIDLFTERSKHNYITFEYQAAKRPPPMLRSRFNVWEHKMGPLWKVVSMPSSLYRAEDALLLNDIEKVRGDSNISKWFTRKSAKHNANFIVKMRSPKLKPYVRARFDQIKREEKAKWKAEQDAAKTAKKSNWWTYVKDTYERIARGEVAWMDVSQELERLGWSEDVRRAFQKDLKTAEKDYLAERMVKGKPKSRDDENV